MLHLIGHYRTGYRPLLIVEIVVVKGRGVLGVVPTLCGIKWLRGTPSITCWMLWDIAKGDFSDMRMSGKTKMFLQFLERTFPHALGCSIFRFQAGFVITAHGLDSAPSGFYNRRAYVPVYIHVYAIPAIGGGESGYSCASSAIPHRPAQSAHCANTEQEHP